MKELIVSIVIIVMSSVSAVAAEQPVYTLQDSYDAAMRSYERIKISEENVVQADSRVDQAWTYIYPRLTAYGGYTRYNDVLPPGGGAFIFQPEDQVNASLVLIQPLYTGGRTLAALRVAKTMQESSRSGLTVIKQNVMLSVADAYYAVIKTQKIVEVSSGSLERMERRVALCCIADLQSARRSLCPTAPRIPAPAECNSAIRQIENLRCV